MRERSVPAHSLHRPPRRPPRIAAGPRLPATSGCAPLRGRHIPAPPHPEGVAVSADLLSVRDLIVSFRTERGTVRALFGGSFSPAPGGAPDEYLHVLPGADDIAQPRSSHRRPGRGGIHRPSCLRENGGRRAGRGLAAAGGEGGGGGGGAGGAPPTAAGVVPGSAARVAIMYLGRIVEIAKTGALFAAPVHPYTQGLLRSLPGTGTGEKRVSAIPGGGS